MENNESKNLKKSTWGIRHIQTLLLFFALMLAYAMRVNITLAIVTMTDTSLENSFDWSMQIQSVILSSFFWGYVVLQIPGGELANKFGGKILITLSLGINAVMSLLLPIGSHYGWQLVCACRVLQGLSQGFIFPCTHHLIGKWVPLEEKGRLGTIIYAGGQLGTALQLLAAGFTAEYLGWPAIFYINGTLSAVWTVFYIFLGSDSPQSSRMISAEERLYIQNSLDQVGEQKKHKTPWQAIATSLPVLSLIVVQTGQNWAGVLMTEIPTYISNVLGLNIKSYLVWTFVWLILYLGFIKFQNGVITALPYVAVTLLSFVFGFISDYVLNKKWLSITACRKISNSINQYGAAIAFLVLTLVPEENVTLAIVVFIFVVGLNAGQYSGFMLVHIDMAPNFAGTLMGISNSISNIISIFSPLVVGILVQDQSDANEWRKVFYLCAAVYIVCNTFFLLFGTSERQSWNKVDNECEDTEKENEKVV